MDLAPVADRAREFLGRVGYADARLMSMRNIGRVLKVEWDNWRVKRGNLYLGHDLKVVGFELEDR
jgi:hypothetical protein